jgi:hypothetical protein
MKNIMIAFLLTTASISLGQNLEEKYEKAYYQETVKGNRAEALAVYRKIAAEEPNDENREVVIKALNRMLILYAAPSAGTFKRAMEKLNLDFEMGALNENTQVPAIWGGGGTGYEFAVDDKIKKAGRYACRIKQIDKGTFGTITGTLDPALVTGRTIRMSGYMKLEDVENSVGLWFRADRNQKAVAFCNMHDQQIKGTSDWQHYSFELKIPRNIDNVNFGTLLAGPGTVWADELTIEIVE